MGSEVEAVSPDGCCTQCAVNMDCVVWEWVGVGGGGGVGQGALVGVRLHVGLFMCRVGQN